MKSDFILLVAAAFSLGCSRGSQPSHSIKTIKAMYRTNEPFSFELSLNADAGYQWYYTVSDTTVVAIDSVSYKPYSGTPNQVGGLIIETFHCRTLQIGTCTLNLEEIRPWLRNVPPIDSLRYMVSVIKQ